MATTNTDNVVVREDVAPIYYPVDATGTYTFNQGDMVWMDATTNKYIQAIDSDAHCDFFAGVALDGPYIQPYSSKVYSAQVPVGTKGIFRFKTTAGETYTDGQAVYFGADAQTIKNTAGGYTRVVGVIKLGVGITSLLGAAGVTVDVHIKPVYPAVAF